MFWKTLILIIALTTSACSTGESMQIEEPFYKVCIKTFGLKYRVVANGVDVKNDLSLRSVNVEIPINQYVRTGDNKFELQLFPLTQAGNLSDSEDAFAEIEFRLYTSLKDYVILSKLQYSEENPKKDDPSQGSTPAGQYFLKDNIFESNKKGDYRRSELNYTVMENEYNKTFISQTVSMKTPFPEWAFLSGDIIEDPSQFKSMDEMVGGLIGEPFKVLEKVHAGLSKKDIDSIMPLFQERNKEMDKAYYYEPGTYEKMLREEMEKDLSDKDFTLDKIDINYAKPMLSPGRHLMELGTSPLIRFVQKDESLFLKYPIVFRKKGNDWIITR